MEAIEFLKETQRMCSSYKECTDCPLKELASFAGYKACRIYMLNECEKAISAVEAWSKEHPIITNARKFEEVFGQKPQSINGIIYCPPFKPGAINCDHVDCMKCLEWWDKQYEEPENA